ncbi:hypothetical protein LOTGIDRAFT_170334 [Lottia gigantea]|uniref:Uncharacterized protein n=1 Tax=Lottia gigantea TaxID=225164 RepID=V4B1G7_LOTGI|nr:hypothetical protein LOTGIDRAFT_170334 [Lottia gigantea]ESO82059.1 hypothetical protein LOTGIDRAFT_170334 [Lottia gigantea]
MSNVKTRGNTGSAKVKDVFETINNEMEDDNFSIEDGETVIEHSDPATSKSVMKASTSRPQTTMSTSTALLGQFSNIVPHVNNSCLNGPVAEHNTEDQSEDTELMSLQQQLLSIRTERRKALIRKQIAEERTRIDALYQLPPATLNPTANPGTTHVPAVQQGGVTISFLEQTVSRLRGKGWAKSTIGAYKTHLKCYMEFCRRIPFIMTKEEQVELLAKARGECEDKMYKYYNKTLYVNKFQQANRKFRPADEKFLHIKKTNLSYLHYYKGLATLAPTGMNSSYI